MRSPSKRRRARALALSAAVALSVVAGACGADSDTSASAGEPANEMPANEMPANDMTGAGRDPSGGDSAGGMTGAGGDSAGSKVLTIKDFAFSPEPLTVPKGTVIKVVNEDDAAHTATAKDDSFDTGELAKGESKEITLSDSGDIAYQCDIHDYMQGVIRVSA